MPTARPLRPLLVYDGDCGFCLRWIQRLRRQTAGRVDYVASQRAAERFPEVGTERVPAADFQTSVVLFEPDGRVSRGAEAIFRSLGARPAWRWLSVCYDAVPGAGALSEWGYRLVARNRPLFSRLDALFVGRDVALSGWQRSRRVFLGALALVAALAFASLGVQVEGLVGSQGIVPVAGWLPAAAEQLGDQAAWRLPTLLWLDASDGMLGALCWGGVALSLLVLLDVAPALCLALMAAAYLSLLHATGRFLAFQWDSLLVEVLILAVWLAPWRLGRDRGQDAPPPALARLLLWWLLFRFLFESGVVKLTSGDPTWRDLTALTYHYWTQPLPHGLSWFAALLPPWLQKLSAAGMFAAELGLPFLILAPRRLRHFGATGMLGLQLAIGATGNYGFFNLLSSALCLSLLDDQWFERWCPWPRPRATGPAAGELPPWTPPPPERVPKRVSLPVYAALALSIGALQLRDLWREQPGPDPAQVEAGALATLLETGPWAALRLLEWKLEPFRAVNPYGLFRVMTKTRPEIRIQGSASGYGPGGEPPHDWVEYDFRWKPDALDQRPRWCQPHMPRLDWLLWFDALRWEPYARQGGGRFPGTPELQRLMGRLLEGAPAVLDLLSADPFPAAPPRSVRAQLWTYRFATPEEHERTGAFWVAAPLDTRGLTLSRRE